jgi:hypothetical protein
LKYNSIPCTLRGRHEVEYQRRRQTGTAWVWKGRPYYPRHKKGKRSCDTYLEGNFAEHYSGKYLVVDEVVAKQKRYDDKKKYRHIFDEDKRTENKGNRSIGSYGQSTYAMYSVSYRVSCEV